MIDDRLFLRRKGRAARISYFVEEARTIDFAVLADEYSSLRATAPRRTRNYLEPARSSRASESVSRSEERLAARLVLSGKHLLLRDQNAIRPIDFQVPLKAVLADALVGKIDLVGVSDRLVVIELKVARTGGGGDTPLNAILEALSYAAIVEANYQRFVFDCRAWDLRPTYPRPGLLVLGDVGFWKYWDYTPAARGWRSALTELIAGLDESIGLSASLAALPDDWSLGTGPVPLTNPLLDQANP
jgi:hypothetical protein